MLSPTDFIELPELKQKEFLLTLNGNKEAFLKQVKKVQEENAWVEALNTQAREQADAISRVMGCPIEVAVFVIEPLKDAAVAFFKKPDAKTMFKIFRNIMDNVEAGVELCARAQLVRKEDLVSRETTGDASDPRFMDANGNYDPKDSDLNFALLMKANRLITFMQDQFKKK